MAKPRRPRFAALAVAALIGAASGVAEAHDRSVSYSDVRLDDDGARLRARVTRLDLSRLPLDPFGGGSGEDELARYVAERLAVQRGGQPCPT